MLVLVVLVRATCRFAQQGGGGAIVHFNEDVIAGLIVLLGNTTTLFWVVRLLRCVRTLAQRLHQYLEGATDVAPVYSRRKFVLQVDDLG